MKAENASDSVFAQRRASLPPSLRGREKKKYEAYDTACIFHASHDQSVPSRPSINGINYYRIRKKVLEDVAIIIMIGTL